MTDATTDNIFVQHSSLSAPVQHADALRVLPDDVHELMAAIQGLMIHDAVAKDFYDCDLSEERTDDIHLRSLEAIVNRILDLDDQPLTETRAAENRIAGRCRNYVLLLIGALREKDIPARARCGFGSYFNPGSFEDHWVCEYQDRTDGKWRFADPQFDAIWRKKLSVSHDTADVPRDHMRVAGDAWQLCRSGRAKPSQFGISFVGLHGLWMVAGNLVRDIAALNRMELQPWDVWGAQPPPDEALNEEQLAFFDRLATLSREPDKHIDALRDLYANDDRVRVPSEVFNALRDRSEPVTDVSAGANHKEEVA